MLDKSIVVTDANSYMFKEILYGLFSITKEESKSTINLLLAGGFDVFSAFRKKINLL